MSKTPAARKSYTSLLVHRYRLDHVEPAFREIHYDETAPDTSDRLQFASTGKASMLTVRYLAFAGFR